MVWVKFHEEITKGAKRGLPRGVRFVLLELSLLARPRRGFVDLPAGMSDLDGLHDLLGGDKKEIVRAVEAFGRGSDPVILFEDTEDGRRVVIPKWAKWNSIEASGSSTERTRRHKGTRRERGGNDRSLDTGTATERAGNAEGTPARGEKNRGDQIPPSGGESARASGSGSSGSMEPSAATGIRAARPPEVHDLLAALRDGPLAPVATAGFAERVLAKWTCGRPIGGATEAIRDVSDRAVDASWSEDYMRDRVLAFVSQANKSAPLAAPGPRAGPRSPDARARSDVQRGGWTEADAVAAQRRIGAEAAAARVAEGTDVDDYAELAGGTP